MGAINHLMANNAAPGASRVEGVDADRMNSIVERIAGVNPSKLAAGVTGEVVTPGAAEPQGTGGFPMSGTPLQQAVAQQQMNEQHPYGQPQQQPQGGTDPQVMAQMQQLYEKVQHLQGRLAYYETSSNVVGYDPNRGTGIDNQAFSPKMGPKAKKRRKDPGDGIPDDVAARADAAVDQRAIQGEMMLSNPLAELGLDMTECLDLAGMMDGVAPEPRAQPQYQASSQPQYQAPAPMVEHREEVVEEADLDELWEYFLEQRGVSLEELDALSDDALARNDGEQMEMILALEDQFHELLGGRLAKVGELAQKGIAKVGDKTRAAAKGLGKAVLKAPGAVASGVAGGIAGAAKAAKNLVAPGAGAPAQAAPATSAPAGAPAAAPAAPAPAAAAPAPAPAAPAPAPAPAAAAPAQSAPSKPVPGAAAQKMKKKLGLTARKEHVEGYEFEADADNDGSPHKIPWERILKAYRVQQAPSASATDTVASKDERGFGSQNVV